MTALRVLANLCSVVPGQVGGAESYAARLLAAVASRPGALAAGVDLQVASMAGVRSAHPELGALAWREARWGAAGRARRAVVESTWLVRRSGGFDVVHHFGGRLPARRAGRSVLTVHDIGPLDMPEHFSPAKRRYLGWALPRSVRAADLVAVPSQWVAGRLVERLGVPPERIRVVPSTYACPDRVAEPQPLAAPEPLAEPQPLAAPEPLAGVPFVLYPAATYPHKNHSMLIAAHAAVRSSHPDAVLVLTGAPGRAHTEVADQAARTPGVVHLGWVDDVRLASLMSSAAVVAFPSRYEGFGLPVLEAMHAGTPVVAADATAVPEVVRDGGTLVDPDDLDGWADALLEARSGSARISRLVERGRARAADFAPDLSAQRLLEAWWFASRDSNAPAQ